MSLETDRPPVVVPGRMSLTYSAEARSFQERVAATPVPDGDESGCSVVATVPRALAPPTV